MKPNVETTDDSSTTRAVGDELTLPEIFTQPTETNSSDLEAFIEEEPAETIEEIIQVLGLPARVKEKAKEIKNEGREIQINTRSNDEKFNSAVVYIASRQENIPVRPSDFAKLNETVSTQDVSKLRRKIVSDLNLKIHPATPEMFLYRYVNQLGFSETISQDAMKILQRAREDENLTGAASSIAAGLVYLAGTLSDEVEITQNAVSEVSGYSNVTIRNQYHTYEEYA